MPKTYSVDFEATVRIQKEVTLEDGQDQDLAVEEAMDDLDVELLLGNYEIVDFDFKGLREL